MPPKGVVKVATGPRRSSRIKHEPELFANSNNSVTVKAPAGKRKADTEVPSQPTPKRGRPAKASNAAAKATPAATTRRGPGRPKKDATPAATSTGRGRGRPKKVTTVAAPLTATTVARGRGRPKKVTTDAAPATATPIARGRGRPKKNATATAPTTSTASRAKKTAVSRKPAAAKAKAPSTSISTATTKPAGRKPPTSRKAPEPRKMLSKRPAEEVDEPDEPVAKKAKASSKKSTALSQPTAPLLALHPPTEILTILLTGQGDSGELGMGVGKPGINAKRPRLNKNLLRDHVGVVQLAAGGMHCVALTYDNKILTWGVNDQGALGRSTEWDGGLKDMNADDSDSEEGDGDLNPHEATPAAVDFKYFMPGTQFVQVIAGDSATFALTSTGHVYGWGTFRDNQGVLGFTKKDDEQRTPILIEPLKNIKAISCGNNFVLALTSAGTIFSWGAGQQNQLGRDVSDDERYDALRPHQLTLDTEITAIFAGSDHSFAIAKDGNVYSWGLNNFGQCGITASAGDSSAVVRAPTIVAQLGTDNIAMLAGGTHHSLAVSHDGDCLAWGRTDKSQMGFDVSTMPEDQIARSESTNKIALLKVPTVIPSLPPKSIAHVAAGSDHCIAVTQDGKAYSWGFSAQFETGQGTDDDIESATLLSNTALKDQHVTWAGCGGQFSVLATIPGAVQTAAGSADVATSAAVLTESNDAAFAHNQTSSTSGNALSNGAPSGAWKPRVSMGPGPSGDSSSDSDDDRRAPVGPQSPRSPMRPIAGYYNNPTSDEARLGPMGLKREHEGADSGSDVGLGGIKMEDMD